MNLLKPMSKLASVVLLAIVLTYAACSSNDEPKPVDCNTTDLAITLISQSNPASCGTNNGTIVVSATGGDAPYKFKINSGTFGTVSTFNNLGGGSFNITVKDANNCEKILSTITLSAPSSPVAGASTIAPHTDCLSPNGSITLSISGGTPPYQYKLGTGAFGTSNIFSQLKAGNYTITVQDNVNCSITVNGIVANNTTVSFQTEINTILDTNCNTSGCHNGDLGTSRNWTVFSTVKTNAASIKSRTGARTMPPSGSPQLTQSQIDLIACWVDAGSQNN